jgi:predicted secreted protein
MFHPTLVLGVVGSLLATAALAHPDIRTGHREVANIAKFAATAREAVVPDEAVVTLSASHQGTDVAAATRDVLQEVDDALRSVAGVPGVVAETSGFQTIRDYRFVNGAQVPDGWTVRDEITLKSAHFKPLGELTGRLARTLHVEATSTRISSGLRERAERSLTAKAIASFRAKAATVTREFGLHRYVLLTIDVGSLQGDRSMPRPPYPMMTAQRAMTASPLPIAPGEAPFSVTVSGSVRME